MVDTASEDSRSSQDATLHAQLNDPVRLAALREVALLDTPVEEGFDRLTRLAIKVLHCPVSLVSLVDEDRQFFKSSVGLSEPWASRRETPLSHSFCQHTIASGEPLIVEDARLHPWLRDNLAIPELGVVAYAGIPLLSRDRQILGSFCAIDTQPRRWTEEEIEILQDLAASVITEIELRLFAHETRRLAAEQTAVLQQIADGVVVTNAAGTVIFTNDAASLIFGQHLHGLSLDEYASAFETLDLNSAVVQPDQLALARSVLYGETVTGLERRLVRPDGTSVVVQNSAGPIRSEDGSCLGAVAIVRDVTEQHDLAEQRDTFISTAAHDLKTPLTTIKGLAQLVLRRARRSETLDSADVAVHMERIESTVNRMTNLMTELLDVSRIELGIPLNLAPRPVDLVTIVREVVADLEHSLNDRKLQVEIGVESLVGTWDQLRLQRVLSNLITNAVQYSPEGSVIHIRLDQESTDHNAEAVLSVRDQGIGVPAADLPHIFDRFYRGSNVDGKIEGNGIGLAGARQIVEQHGGRIEAESGENIGSTFTIHLPVMPAPAEITR